MAAPKEARRRVLDLIAGDPSVDIVVVGITGAMGSMSDNCAADLLEWGATAPKPVVATWNSYKTDEVGFSDLIASGVPLFRSFRNCFQALGAFNRYRVRAASFRFRPPFATQLMPDVRTILNSGGALDPREARELLESFGVPLVRETAVTSPADAARVGSEYGWPVALKIASPLFPHKSDVGLVRLGVRDASEAMETYTALMMHAHALIPESTVTGVVVQDMVDGDTEMIVGTTNDIALGPAVMIGLGGVFAEVLGDVAVRPLPLDEEDINEMIHELRGAPLLFGARGRPVADVGAFVNVVMAVARLASACDGVLMELDLNPVMVGPSGAVAVDYLVVSRGIDDTRRDPEIGNAMEMS